MAPAVLDNPATLSPYLLQWLVAGLTISFTAAAERRVIRALARPARQQQQLALLPPAQQQPARQRRQADQPQPGGLAADISWAFWRSSAIAAGALLGATAFGRLAATPSLPLLCRHLAGFTREVFALAFRAAFPCAAALTGASFAVWRVKLAFLRPATPAATVAAAGALAVGQQGRGASPAGQCGQEQRRLWSSFLLAALVVVLT